MKALGHALRTALYAGVRERSSLPANTNPAPYMALSAVSSQAAHAAACSGDSAPYRQHEPSASTYDSTEHLFDRTRPNHRNAAKPVTPTSTSARTEVLMLMPLRPGTK